MDYDRKLEELRAEAMAEVEERRKAAPAMAGPGTRAPVHPALLVASAVGLAVLPFALLVRTAVSLHRGGAGSPWLAVAAGVVATALVATAYGAWFSHRLTGRPRVLFVLKWVALPVVIAYTAHALFYISSANAKSEAVRAEFRAVHPVLRLALSTLVLADRSIVVTDMSRELVEYRRMGLPAPSRSQHQPQPDGWVYAVDVRTAGRSRIVNALVALYFRAMGFTTLRHVGTADHLHVALPVPSSPS